LNFRTFFLAALACQAQDLTPRAYVISPVKSNAVTLSYLFSDGDVLFDPSLPIEGSQGQIHTSIFTYYHSLNLYGRSANVTASLPYSVGNFEALVFGVPQSVYRSGLMDSVYRLSVNLKGGPAMSPQQFSKWQQKTVIGASVKVLAPTGQYDPARLINQGSHRWAFKPEVGVSQRWGRWILDGYAAVWFFTPNNQFYTGQNHQQQQPIGAFETHLSYDVKPRLWFSFDGNFWVGGRSVVNDVVNVNSLQRNSRIGATASFPLDRHQSIKVSYSSGAYVIYGGAYRSLSFAWQYSWLGTKFR
jgi:hypothetical protein